MDVQFGQSECYEFVVEFAKTQEQKDSLDPLGSGAESNYEADQGIDAIDVEDG